MGVKILAFNGSLRAGSWDYKMVESAARIADCVIPLLEISCKRRPE